MYKEGRRKGSQWKKRKGKNWKDKEKLKHKDTVNPDEVKKNITTRTCVRMKYWQVAGGGKISFILEGEGVSANIYGDCLTNVSVKEDFK